MVSSRRDVHSARAPHSLRWPSETAQAVQLLQQQGMQVPAAQMAEWLAMMRFFKHWSSYDHHSRRSLVALGGATSQPNARERLSAYNSCCRLCGGLGVGLLVADIMTTKGPRSSFRGMDQLDVHTKLCRR
jgi:hypothetical protein